MLICESICKTYRTGAHTVEALKNVSVSVADREIAAIVGPSGAGKSTLLHILACVQSSDSGSYTLDGVCVDKMTDRQKTDLRCKNIGIVFQNFLLLPENTVRENIEIPMIFAGIRRKQRLQACREALERVELPAKLLDRDAKDLSGGQKQRVAIARAIVNHPGLLLADEPTGALDTKTGNEILQCFENIRESGSSVVIVTHDRNIARRCDRIIRIVDGEIAEGEAAD